MNMRKAQVFILLGQSNAVGHDLPMQEEDKIHIPLKNVFGLSREKNQSFGINMLSWDGYISSGMNLGETQDDTYSLANCLAAQWQNRINQGEDLSDLYIVQIAIGGQGVTKKYMWYPQKEQILVPGTLWETNISLFQFAKHILSLLPKSFDNLGIEYEILGLHWRGGEEEINVPIEELDGCLMNIYQEMFTNFWDALECKPETVLHQLVLEERAKLEPTGNVQKSMDYVNTVFQRLSREYNNVNIFDTRSYPLYNCEVKGYGLFKEDLTHYTREVNEWLANNIIEKCKNEATGE